MFVRLKALLESFVPNEQDRSHDTVLIRRSFYGTIEGHNVLKTFGTTTNVLKIIWDKLVGPLDEDCSLPIPNPL